MQRRSFIILLGGIVGSPLIACAQQKPMPVIGFLALSSADAPSGPVEGIHLGLKGAGYEIGCKVRMEYRYTDNQIERLPVLAAELVNIPASVIVTSGGPRVAL